MKLLFTILFSLAVSFSMATTPSGNPDDILIFSGDVQLEMSVYPNPSTTGDFSLEVSNLSREDIVLIKVYNLIGSTVYYKQFTSVDGDYKQVIRLGTMPKGIYMLEVSIGNKKQTRRLSFI